MSFFYHCRVMIKESLITITVDAEHPIAAILHVDVISTSNQPYFYRIDCFGSNYALANPPRPCIYSAGIGIDSGSAGPSAFGFDYLIEGSVAVGFVLFGGGSGL